MDRPPDERRRVTVIWRRDEPFPDVADWVIVVVVPLRSLLVVTCGGAAKAMAAGASAAMKKMVRTAGTEPLMYSSKLARKGSRCSVASIRNCCWKYKH